MTKKLKQSKYAVPSRGLSGGEDFGLIHLSPEGYNLLIELLEEKAQQSVGDVKEIKN